MTKHSETRREEILQAAAKLFRENGFEKTTVRQLGEKVGIQSGSLFHYFKSKEEILIAMIEETIAENKKLLLESIAGATTSYEKLHNLIRTELELFHGEKRDSTAVLVQDWRKISQEQKRGLYEHRKDYENLWLSTLEEAAQEGVISPNFNFSILRRLIFGSFAWTVTWYKPEGPLNLDDLTKQILLLIVSKTDDANQEIRSVS